MSSASASCAFFRKLNARIDKTNSLLCVGLDPHASEIAEIKSAASETEQAYAFCENIIKATEHVACCYKPQAAFFEQFGFQGWELLKRVLALIPSDIPVIFDCKRGDIGSTAAAYAKGCFQFGDCLTVNPYMGSDGVLPFVDSADKAAFVLCKTSNPGSNELQTLSVGESKGLLYMEVARLCAEWGRAHGNVGVVVGATDTAAMTNIREGFPDMWILAPGVGAQGGDLEGMLKAGLDARGRGVLVAVSRGISRAGDVDKQRQAADTLVDDIRRICKEARK